jgi:predicted aspartyl protease
MSVRPGACLPLLLTLLAAAGCQPAGDGPASVDIPAAAGDGEVALRFVGANDAALVVPVSINGEGPYDFILDTGATMTCVTTRLAERLELPDQAGAMGVGAGIGGSGQVRIVRVDSVAVGQVVASEMSACVLDLDHIAQLGVEVDGLLGLNFLRSFAVTLDFGRDVLRLAEPR